MKHVAVILLLVLVADVDRRIVDAIACTPNDNNTALVTDELIYTDFIVNFDGIEFYGVSSVPVLTSDKITVTLSGTSNCLISGDMGLGGVSWDGALYWYLNDTKPGDFIVLNADKGSGEYCTLTFSEPISYFSIRVGAASGRDPGIFIYDESGTELSCNIFPWPGFTDVNGYFIRGFLSNNKNIKSIQFKDGFFAADLLRGSICALPSAYVAGSCKTPCEVNPCGFANSKCDNNADGTTTCTCAEYYEGNSTNGCIPRSCTNNGLCNPNAACYDLSNSPFVNCSCIVGVGDGFGPNGCVIPPAGPPITPPVSIPISTTTPISEPISPTADPVSTPISSVPINNPTSTPSKKVSSSSFMKPLLWLTCCWILATFIV